MLHLHKQALQVAKKFVSPSPLLPQTPVGSQAIVPLPHTRTSASPQLSGVWASRANVLSPLFQSDSTGEGREKGVWSIPGSGSSAVKNRPKSQDLSFGRAQSRTPSESGSLENVVKPCNPHPQQRSFSGSFHNRPFHHSVSGPSKGYYPPNSPHRPSKTRPLSEEISQSDQYQLYSRPEDSLSKDLYNSSSHGKSRDSSRDSSKDRSWNMVTGRKSRVGAEKEGDGQSSYFQRSQSTTNAHRQSSGGGRAGRRGRGSIRKPCSEPILNKTHHRGK